MKSDISRKTLSNGLRLLHIKNKQNKILVEINFLVGSENEVKENAGISHFLEHMVCEGSKEYSGDIIRGEMKKIEGHFNAGTSLKRTSYYVMVPKRHFEKSLEMLASIVQSPLIDEAQVEKEKSIILNELKQRKDNAHLEVDGLLMSGLFEKHPLSNETIGSEENILGFNSQKLREHYDKYYAPNNALITITGNLEDPSNLIEKYFTFQPKVIEQKVFVVPDPIKQKVIQKKGKTKSTYLSIGFQSASTTHQDSNILSVIENVLDYGKKINLMDEIRHKRALTYSLSVCCQSFQETGYFAVELTTETSKVEEASNAVLSELKKIETISSNEVELAKKREIKMRGKVLRSPNKLHGILTKLELFDAWNEYENFKQNIERVTVEDVRRVAKQYFNENYAKAIIEQGVSS